MKARSALKRMPTLMNEYRYQVITDMKARSALKQMSSILRLYSLNVITDMKARSALKHSPLLVVQVNPKA